jgi:uncharacterized protein YidB (DUF937 family)
MARSNSTPSLIALLGLVAVAGYQNRGRISDMLTDARDKSAANDGSPQPAGDGFLSDIGQFFQSGQVGNSVSAALGDLVDRFKASGRGDTADSWVSNAANHPLDVAELEAALGDDVLSELGRKSGLSRQELLLRLNTALPDVVNRFTPKGRLPTQDETPDTL